MAQPASTALRPRPGQPLRVGVFGDPMAEGLYASLYRELNAVPGVTVNRFSEVSTGLSRYDYVNIQTKTERQIRETPIDAAVIMFGTNDAQGIEVNGQVHAFGTPGWRDAYGQRIENLAGPAGSGDCRLLGGHAPHAQGYLRSQDGHCEHGHSGPASAVGRPVAGYPPADQRRGWHLCCLSDRQPGRRVQMRAGDGIHMSMAGYERMGQPMAQLLLQDAGLEPVQRSSAGN
ncbi:MAG: DUF459 domain-containing protein [Brevundimonas sp.]|nr:MAG: DUF459 domain-containing protein [Brevundimonas sp.]